MTRSAESSRSWMVKAGSIPIRSEIRVQSCGAQPHINHNRVPTDYGGRAVVNLSLLLIPPRPARPAPECRAASINSSASRPWSCHAGPRVRIHFPPAASLRTFGPLRDERPVPPVDAGDELDPVDTTQWYPRLDFQLTSEQQRLQNKCRELAFDFATRTAAHDRDASHPVENCSGLAGPGADPDRPAEGDRYRYPSRGRPAVSWWASAIVRVIFSASGESSRADMSPLEKWVVSRGTDGSNPVPSSSQSVSTVNPGAVGEKPRTLAARLHSL